MIKRVRIFVTGRVQGVGFRPYVYRLAAEHSLTGFVFNDTKGVTIEVQGAAAKVAAFESSLNSHTDSPPLMKITSCKSLEIPVIIGEAKFAIHQSDSAGPISSEVAADSATCADCLRELSDPDDFRFRYPFINCTNCGPRYSIIKAMPYDRSNTTMSAFPMCLTCQSQYESIEDRRFHAQPVACKICGPRVWLTDSTGQTIETNTEQVICRTIELLLSGKIVAIKGIGGFHLAVDATNEDAVRQLRSRKQREHKPFALMTASIDMIESIADVSDDARQLLQSPPSPIVLLPAKQGTAIAPSVAPGTSSLGFMLCYAPLHHLLFSTEIDGRNLEVLVMTSGNVADEPLIKDNDEALEKLSSIADYFLMHDRDIYRQVDDSVVQIIDHSPAVIRRSRGFVPTPVLLDFDLPVDILAVGSDMKNTFCLGKKNQLILSEHIGDLQDAPVYRHYRNSISHISGLFDCAPKIIACDLHPGYVSTQFAQSLKNVTVLPIQHHWAHAASVLAEYGFAGPVIALAADGTGFGTDGAIWGCECLIATLEKFERFGHLDYYSLAGSDKASKEPIRPLLGLLKHADGQFELEKYSWLLGRIEPDTQKQRTILTQLEKNINISQTSSLGRVFDAVAAALGLGTYNHFEAQLPMALESIIKPGITQSYNFGLNKSDTSCNVDFAPMLADLLVDIKSGIEESVMAAKFHNTVAQMLLALAESARDKTAIDTVALSGGVFCNRYLSETLITLLKQNNFCVLLNRYAPANDGGVALGQAAIAAHYLKLRGC